MNFKLIFAVKSRQKVLQSVWSYSVICIISSRILTQKSV